MTCHNHSCWMEIKNVKNCSNCNNNMNIDKNISVCSLSAIDRCCNKNGLENLWKPVQEVHCKKCIHNNVCKDIPLDGLINLDNINKMDCKNFKGE